MRPLILSLMLLSFFAVKAQIRAFDNSKSILPWIYNPSANFAEDVQVYVGYDGRGNSSALLQSYVAGLRMPLTRAKGGTASASFVGLQLMNTSQDVMNHSTVQANFAHRIAITEKLKVAFGLGAGVGNTRYNYNDLIYRDPQDPLLANNGENVFNIHLNAGFSLVMDEKLFINLAAPYLIKDHRANVNEMILRAGYILAVTADINLITAGNLDTFNNDLVFGGDLRAEWKKTVSLLAGADRYKYHGGVLLNLRTFSFGYAYGRNFSDVMDYVPSHQVSIFSSMSFLARK